MVESAIKRDKMVPLDSDSGDTHGGLSDGGQMLRGCAVVVSSEVLCQQIWRDSRPSWYGYRWVVRLQGRLRWDPGLE